MSTARVAVNRGMAASRETTPSNSRSASRHASATHSPANSKPSSRSASREMLNSDNLAQESSLLRHPLDNPVRITRSLTLNDNQNPNLLSPVRAERPTLGSTWYGSNSNLTSTDSTPSSENTNDSGPGTDSSPLSSPLTALGFSQNTGNNNTCLYRMPIVGYEVLEERSRFTVFKIQVMHRPSGDQWFVFRRYTDFVRLNKRLRSEFPGLRFALPPKRWFGDNFDPIFLEDRQLGLQAFIDNIIGHAKIREKKCVRDFFCLDDPPGAHDTLEESRAMCQSLEENIVDLQEQLRDRDGEIAVLKSQVNFLMAQQHTLVKALRLECELQENEIHSPGSTHDLNMALLSICEKTLNGGFPSSSQLSSIRNRESTSSVANLPPGNGNKPRAASMIDSPVRKALEKVFIPRSDSHPALTTPAQVASASVVNGSEPSDTSRGDSQDR
ncbi:uncharacterized protein [Macrobrachium rosenbergii]|uniref:uncharacterized protein n=1 Tax=Macrobrachium rosenbergii TaxID=79674 RepID=UPI0034D5C5EF